MQIKIWILLLIWNASCAICYLFRCPIKWIMCMWTLRTRHCAVSILRNLDKPIPPSPSLTVSYSDTAIRHYHSSQNIPLVYPASLHNTITILYSKWFVYKPFPITSTAFLNNDFELENDLHVPASNIHIDHRKFHSDCSGIHCKWLSVNYDPSAFSRTSRLHLVIWAICIFAIYSLLFIE